MESDETDVMDPPSGNQKPKNGLFNHSNGLHVNQKLGEPEIDSRSPDKGSTVGASLENGHGKKCTEGTRTGVSVPVLLSYPEGSVERTSAELAYFVVDEMTERKLSPYSRSRACKAHGKTMIRTVEEMSTKHELLFKGMMRKLEVTEKNAAFVLTKVVDEIFTDKLFNWGRIVTVYAFAGWLTRHCKQNGMESCVDEITEATCQFVITQLSPWITKSGGWDAFDKFFEKEDSAEQMIWKGLLYTIFGLGVGAVATAIAVK